MIKFDLYFDEDNNKFVAVDPETGETKDLEIKKTRKSSTKVKIDDSNSDPEITLESNKYCLNLAAVQLLAVEPDDKLVIRYIHGDPVIGKNSTFGVEAGNKLTKSFTVSCRGKGNEELARFGNKFSLTPGEKEGLFIMHGDAPELPKETEEIANPNDIDDLESLIDNSDEISNFDFNNFNV